MLKRLLRQRCKDPTLLGLCGAMIDGFPGDPPGTGLPIGSLTSQHFANWYLAGCGTSVRGR